MLISLEQLAREVQRALLQMRERVEALELQLAALAPMLDSDRLEVARICQQSGTAIKDLDGRAATALRAEAASRAFRALRQRGWSLDRIARATGYSSRGVASNLARYGTV